jgi:hypothetical protein
MMLGVRTSMCKPLVVAVLSAVISLLGLGSVPAAGSVGLKPVITGLLDRKGAPPAALVPAVDGFVVRVRWADLQPTASGPIADHNAIDAAIAKARALAPGADYHLKLRVLAGTEAPTWAKNLDGGPVSYFKGRKVLTYGRFWTSSFGAAYADLQAKLAARYDTVPEIAETVISRCTILDAEPFLRAVRTDRRTLSALVAAGFTASADQVCHTEEIDAHGVWAQTRSGLTLDPYDRIGADGTASVDESFTESMMVYCRNTLGARCVLENNGISSPLLPDPYPTMYAAIRAMGPPFAFQTASPKAIGDWYATLRWAADQGANHVELNIDYPTYDPAQLASVRSQLRANATQVG